MTTEIWEFTTGDTKQTNPILKNRHYDAGSGIYLVDIDYCRKLSLWGDWSTCSTSCGGGEMIRSRSCLRDCESSTDDLTQTQARERSFIFGTRKGREQSVDGLFIAQSHHEYSLVQF